MGNAWSRLSNKRGAVVAVDVPECPVCFGQDALGALPCHHPLCHACKARLREFHGDAAVCPLCRQFIFHIGLFEFITNARDRAMLIHAYQTVTRTQMWQFLATYPDAFQPETVHALMDLMRHPDTPDVAETYMSVVYTLSHMRFIAKYGYAKYRYVMSGLSIGQLHYSSTAPVGMRTLTQPPRQIRLYWNGWGWWRAG